MYMITQLLRFPETLTITNEIESLKYLTGATLWCLLTTPTRASHGKGT